MIAAPPLDAGGLNRTSAEAFLADATTDCGAEGTVSGVPDAAADAGPDPIVFRAVTVNE